MAGPRLLTAGEAFEDLVFVGLERLPAAGEEIKTDTFHATIGGGAVITAVAAARLGVSTAILSALSAPAVARLRRERVRVHNLKQPREPHAISAALSTTTDRAFVTFTGVNRVLEPRLLAALRTAAAGHVHLALTPHDLDAWTACVRRLKRRGATVSWDFGWSESLALRPELPALMDALDLVFVNELEAPLYARVNALDDAYPPLRARTCAVIVKLGSLGSRWLRRGPEGDVVMPAPRVTPVDTTGAGDAFSAGFLAAWLRGSAPAHCLATGNTVGAASTAAPGGLDALPRAADLPAMLRPRAPSTARRPGLPPAAKNARAAGQASGPPRATTARPRPPARRRRATRRTS
ncbi:MAG: carbohydrate kinase family protein [Vicinamibacterales bacterium]